MRGAYSNSHNRNRTRLDTRPQSDPYVAAGLRKIHRDTRGNVIGAMTPEGQRITAGPTMPGGGMGRSWSTSPTPRLDAGPQTPRLDAGPQTPRLDAMAGAAVPGGGNPAPSFAAQERAARSRSKASGAFGRAWQKVEKRKGDNLNARKALYADMKAGTVDTSEARKRATALGVTSRGWRNATNRLHAEMPAMALTPPGAGPAPASAADLNALPADGKNLPIPETARRQTAAAWRKFKSSDEMLLGSGSGTRRAMA